MEDFQYGPLARGLFIALCWLSVLLGFTAPNLIPWHLGLLLFLGLGLKPLLLRTGLHRGWLHLVAEFEARRHAVADRRKARRVERKRRDDRLRKARSRSPDLPPRW
jgi:hypothetical protein